MKRNISKTTFIAILFAIACVDPIYLLNDGKMGGLMVNKGFASPSRLPKETLADRYASAVDLLQKKKYLLWTSTAPDSVRGSHYLLPCRAYNNNSRQTSFEFFVNTTGLRDKENKKIFGDVIDLELFDKIDEVNPLGDIGEVLRELSIEQHRLGLFTRFAAHLNDFIFKFEVPILLSLNHPWMSFENQRKLTSYLSERSDTQLLPSEQVTSLKNLLLDPNFDIRIGDVRFAAKWIPFPSPDIEPYIGIETFLPIIKPSHFDTPNTTLTYPQTEVTLEDLLNSITLETFPDGSEVDQYSLSNPNDLYKFLFDTLTVLRTTQLSPTGDNLKFGFGFLIGANVHLSERFDLFTRFRINRLIGGARYRIIPVEEQLVPSEFKVKISPVSIIQATLGVATNFHQWSLSLGYDLHFKTEEKILEIEVTEEARAKLRPSRAEIAATSQHKLLAELTREGKTCAISFGGDYTIFSKCSDREWSIMLSVTTHF